MNIWQFQETLSSRLIRINVVNALIGLALNRAGGFWKGVGSQAFGWAIINIAIGYFGRRGTRKRLDEIDAPNSPEVQRKESRKLRNILLVNCFLNPLYILGGWRFMQTRGKNAPLQRGIGVGIMIQGALLAVFDIFHVTRLIRDTATRDNLRRDDSNQ